jgi:hypothetical protein
MVFTRKFSQFVPEPVDEVVGLTDGANAIGPNGGGGDNIAVIDQPNAFIPGQWVRIDVDTQVYVLALADSKQDAETWWLVIAATPTQFTIQGGVTRVDFSTFTTTVPGLLPFIIGSPQYISSSTPGLMTYDIPTIPGYVNKPLFIADGPTTGWILSARGYVVAVNQGNPNMCNMVTVSQPGNGFVVGDVIYATTTPNVYAKAIASGTFAESDRVGVVVTAGDPTFTYQTEGNAINVIVTDDIGAPINPGVRYYLSPTVAGKVTATQPIATNQYSVPVYIPYAVAGGIITPQRSLLGPVVVPGAGSIVPVSQAGNGFVVGDVIYATDTPNVYAKAIASGTFAESDRVGVVVTAGDPTFTYQTEGNAINVIVTDDIGAPITPGFHYWLSPTVAGKVTAIQPIAANQYSVPVYIPYAVDAGVITPQRSLLGSVAAGPASMVPVSQAGNGFVAGDVIYATTTPNVYAKAIASGTFAESDRVGVVVTAGDPTFTYQTEGNAINVIVTDDIGAPINPGVRYWLSPTVAGKVTATQPIAANQYSVPVYNPFAVDAGVITPQRSLLGPVGAPGSSPPVLLGVLGDGNGFASQTILTGAYQAYWIIFNSTTGNPLQVTNGGGPSGIGFQIYSGGVWTVGGASAYLDGVNSTAGVNTATWWGFVRNTVSPNTMLVVAPLVNQPEIGLGFCLLTSNIGFANISGQIDFADYGVAPKVGYTSAISSAQGIAAAANGLRLIVDGPGAFVPGSGFYLTVFGIPNT